MHNKVELSTSPAYFTLTYGSLAPPNHLQQWQTREIMP